MKSHNEVINNMDNINEKIKNNRIRVSNLYNEGKYNESIKLCEKSINLIFNNKLEKYNKSNIGSFYFMKAKSNKKLKNIDEAIVMINKSLEYQNIGIYTTNTYWLLAECKILQGKNEEALELYNKCIEYYEGKMEYSEDDDECLKGLVSLLSNKAVLLKDEIMVRNAINLYKDKHMILLDKDLLDELHNNLYKVLDKNDIRK